MEGSLVSRRRLIRHSKGMPKQGGKGETVPIVGAVGWMY